MYPPGDSQPQDDTSRIPNAIQPDCALLGCSVATIPLVAAMPTTIRRLVVEVVEAVVLVVVDGSVVVVTEVVAVVGSVVAAVVGTVVAGGLVVGTVVAGAAWFACAGGGRGCCRSGGSDARCGDEPHRRAAYAAADPRSPTRSTAPIAVQKAAGRVRLLVRRPVVGPTPNKVYSFALMEVTYLVDDQGPKTDAKLATKGRKAHQLTLLRTSRHLSQHRAPDGCRGPPVWSAQPG